MKFKRVNAVPAPEQTQAPAQVETEVPEVKEETRKKVTQDYKNMQTFCSTKVNQQGTILCEITGGMIGKAFEGSNIFLDSKVVVNIQQSDKNNKKMFSIPFYLGVDDIYSLKHMLDSGYISKQIALTKLDALAAEVIKQNGMSDTNAAIIEAKKNKISALQSGDADAIRNAEIEVLQAEIMKTEDESSFYSAYIDERRDVVALPAGSDIAEVNNFISGYNVKLPYFEAVIPAYKGGTKPKNGQIATARLFEIVPGNKTDIMLTVKSGPGRVNDKGGITIQKVTQQARFPMSYDEFTRFIVAAYETVNVIMGYKDINTSF